MQLFHLKFSIVGQQYSVKKKFSDNFPTAKNLGVGKASAANPLQKP